MRPDKSLTALFVTLATLMLTNVVYTSKKQKRQLFRESLLPFFGGKIPDSAFQSDRLALNMLNKEGISIPDGVLFDARLKETFHQIPRDDPEIAKSIIKMIHTPDGRFTPSEGQFQNENEVETTYKILIPTYMQNYHLPKFKPVPETVELPFRQVYDGALSTTSIRGQLGFPFYPKPQIWNSFNDYRPYMDQMNHNANKIINVQQNFNTINLKNFVCDRSGKMYPDPETQCRVFHLCHYNGFKETFICPHGTRYDQTLQECRIWYSTPCLNIRIPY